MTKSTYERLNRISLAADRLPCGDQRDHLEQWIDHVLAKAGFDPDIDYPDWSMIDCDTRAAHYKVYGHNGDLIGEFSAVTH